MQIVRTIIWVLIAVLLLIFSINNWNSVQIKIWEDLVLETKIPALVIVSFLAGLLPVWLLHRGTRWQMSRRIRSLESAVRNAIHSPEPGDDPFPKPSERAPDQEAQ